MDTPPWLTWKRAPDRTRQEQEWVETGGNHPNGPPKGMMVNKIVPDTAWNNVAAAKSSSLSVIQSGLQLKVSCVETTQFAYVVLYSYLRSLESYKAPKDSIRTLAGKIPFPEDMFVNA